MDKMAIIIGKKTATWSLPYSENEHELSVNDFWLCMLGYLCGDSLQISINEALAACSVKSNSSMLVS